MLRRRLEGAGHAVAVFHGGLSRMAKEEAVNRFRGPARLLLATEAGSEGRNLQFCNVLVNYDLPWNPMVVEQRIGRLHRIGQTREVHIVNLAAAGTIESHILRLLDQKIRLFELVVGELDVILGEFGGAEKFEGRLAEQWLAAESEEDFARRVEALGADIERSRDAGKEQEELNSLVAPEDNAMRLEREFAALSASARVRLGYGTNQLVKAGDWEAKRVQLGVHVKEIMEALDSASSPEPAGRHPEYGPLVRLNGVTGSGRSVSLTVQVDTLPLVLVDIDANTEAPLVGEVAA
jgi:superfamily II DNA/RNA helicase